MRIAVYQLAKLHRLLRCVVRNNFRKMDKFEPPEALNFEGNLVESWRRWKQELTL